MKRNLKPALSATKTSTCMTGIGLLLFILFLPHLGIASTKIRPKQNHWFISGLTGIAIRSPEISAGFNLRDEGFRHQPGFAFDVSFGKAIGKRWETAVRWGAYTLFGQSHLPHYTSAGYYMVYPGIPEQAPIEYVTQSNALSLILRFLFSRSPENFYSSTTIHPFIEAGLGINNYVTEVRYSTLPAAENAALIFRNRNGENANGAVQVTTGLGLKIGTHEQWNAIILLNADWVNFTPLNAVSQITKASKRSSGTIASRITAGLAIPIKRTAKRDQHLPFRW